MTQRGFRKPYYQGQLFPHQQNSTGKTKQDYIDSFSRSTSSRRTTINNNKNRDGGSGNIQNGQQVYSLELYIDNVLYPRNIREYKGFVVAEAVYKDKVSGARGNSVIKGNLPYISSYFIYIVDCRRCHDEKKNQSYFQISRVNKVERTPYIDCTSLKWMICTELGNTHHYFLNCLKKLFPKTFTTVKGSRKIKEKRITSKCPKLWSSLITSTEYFKSKRKDMISKWFTTDNIDKHNQKSGNKRGDTIVNTVNISLIMKIPDKSIQLLQTEMDTKNWWLYTFRRHCVSLDEELKYSIKSMEVLREISVSRKELDQDLDELRIHAIECYRYLKRKRKITCSTSFFEDEIPRKYMVKCKNEGPFHNTSALDLLINEAKMIIKEDINTQIVYSLIQDYEQQCDILNSFKEIFDRFYEKKSEGFVIKKEYKGPSMLLTEKQQEVLNAIGNYPIVDIIGLPGRGKTQMIKELEDKYENIVVLSFVGSMVASLKKRGISKTLTIHSAIFKRLKDDEEMGGKEEEVNTPTEDIIDSIDLSTISMIIVDEFTNVDNKLAADLYSIFPSVRCVIHAFDPKQIGSILPGNIAIDLGRALPSKWNIHLTKQLRVIGDDSKDIIENDNLLLAKRVNKIKYTPFKVPASHLCCSNHTDIATSKDVSKTSSSSSLSKAWYLISPSDHDGNNYGNNKQRRRFYSSKLECDLKTLLFTEHSSSICPVNRIGINIDKCKIIALTNSLKDRVNRLIEQQRNPDSSTILFYKGQQITIVARNFKNRQLTYKKRYDPNEKWDGVENYAFYQHRKNTNNNGNPMITVKLDVSSDAVQNGEIYTFDYARDYDIYQDKWAKTTIPMITKNNPLPTQYKKFKRFIFTKSGVKFCIHPTYIPISNIEPGWVITVNKSQGQEYEQTLFILPPSIQAISTCFNIHHLHVAITRAKTKMYLYGDMETLIHIAKNPTPLRYGTLRWKIKLLIKNVDHQQQQRQKQIQKQQQQQQQEVLELT